MPYTLTKRPNHVVVLTAQMPATEVEVERRGIVVDIRRRATLPGFRRGHAPAGVVEKRLESEIRDQLTEHLADQLWRDVMAAEPDLQPLGPPRVTDSRFDDDGSFHLAAEIEIRPRYSLPDPSAATMPQVSLEVSEPEIDAELEKLRKEQAIWAPAAEDAVADEGNLLEVELHGNVVDSDEEPMHEDHAQIVLGGEGVPAELTDALRGARAGDERTAVHTLPEDHPNPKRAGKTVSYRVRVLSVKVQHLADLDDGLAAAVGLETLEQLRERIREVLGANKRAEHRSAQRRAALDFLQDGIDANDLPVSLVQSAVREDVNHLAYSLAMQGRALDAESVDWAQLTTRMEPQSRRRVLDTLVLEQLADEWDIPVPEPEVDAFIRAEATRLGRPPAEHKANIAKEGRLGELRHAARVAAVVDELIRRAGGEVE